MTLVTAALDRAARHCSVTPPTSWASASTTEHVEIRDDFFLEIVDNIRDRIDLPAPIGKQTTITGTGAESYSLPVNFHRLQRDPLAVYETTRLNRAGTPVTSDGLWTHINTIGSAGSFRYFKIEGYPGAHTIKFESDLATGGSVTISYISDIFIRENAGDERNNFDDDNDILLLPRRVVETGIVYYFRKRRGLDPTAALLAFESELQRLAVDGRGLRTVVFGSNSSDWKPMRTPVPDFIPDS